MSDNISIIIKFEGSSYLSLPSKMQNYLSQSGGVITTLKANKLGFSNERLRLFVNQGKLERIAHGVYLLPNELLDKMYVIGLQRPKIIYSHETALYLHELTDRDPINYSVTVPSGYNAGQLRGEGIKVYFVKRDYYEIGATELRTMYGNSVKVYGLERTICDCIRSRNQMDIAVVTEALKRYVRRKDKNLNVLMDMAKIFRITTLLREYLMVLL